jgi:hypothetical protein
MSRRGIRTLVIVLVAAAVVGWRGGAVGMASTAVLMVLAVPLAMVVAVRNVFLRHAAHEVRFEPIPEVELPADLLTARDRVVSLGFVVDGPPRKMLAAAPMVAVPLLHPDKPLKLVLSASPAKPGVRYSIVSLFPDLAASLSTSAEPSLAHLLTPPTSLRQVFAGAPVDVLLAHHERAIAFAAEQGLRVDPIEPGKFEELELWGTQRLHARWRTQPTWHAFVFVVRKLTGMSPHTRPIAQQPAARRAIASLVAGRLHAVPSARVV